MGWGNFTAAIIITPTSEGSKTQLGDAGDGLGERKRLGGAICKGSLGNPAERYKAARPGNILIGRWGARVERPADTADEPDWQACDARGMHGGLQ
jgi:hypothetical protein